MSEFRLADAADGFAVCDARGFECDLDLEVVLHAVHEQVDLLVSLSADDGLVRLGVSGHGEGLVLGQQSCQSRGQLVALALCHRRDGVHGGGLRVVDGCHDDVVCASGEDFEHAGVLEFRHGDDFAGAGLVHRLLVLALDSQKSAEPFRALV